VGVNSVRIITSREPQIPTDDEFTALVIELAGKSVACPPFTVLSCTKDEGFSLPPDCPAMISGDQFVAGGAVDRPQLVGSTLPNDADPAVLIHYHGHAVDAAVDALRQVPFGLRAVQVKFRPGPALGTLENTWDCAVIVSMKAQSWRPDDGYWRPFGPPDRALGAWRWEDTPDSAGWIYGDRPSQQRWYTHAFRWALVVEGGGFGDDLWGAPLPQLLSRHFGPDLVHGEEISTGDSHRLHTTLQRDRREHAEHSLRDDIEASERTIS
jgi:hypothetical protein